MVIYLCLHLSLFTEVDKKKVSYKCISIYSMEVYQNSSITSSRRYWKNIVRIKRVLIEDSTRRWTLWLPDSSLSPKHGFQQSLKDSRKKRLIVESYTRLLLQSCDKTHIDLCYIPWGFTSTIHDKAFQDMKIQEWSSNSF